MTAASCIVLGGHGFVGSAIVKEAQTRGYDVQVVGRKEYDAVKNRECDLLINANGNSRKYLSREDPVLDFQLSVESVLRAFEDFNAARHVFLSSIDVYPDCSNPARNEETAPITINALSPYGFHKYMAEQVVRYRAPDALLLRLGGVLGPGLWKNPVFDLITGQTLRVHPDSAYQYLNTADVARILFDLVEAGQHAQTLNVVGTGAIALRDIAEIIPECRLPDQTDNLARERYEINNDKLTTLATVPESRAVVWRFINDVTNGNTYIGKSGAGA